MFREEEEFDPGEEEPPLVQHMFSANRANTLQRGRDLVLNSVTQNGIALQHVSKTLRGDREIVTAAVTSNGDALQYASAELRAELHSAVTQLEGGGLLEALPEGVGGGWEEEDDGDGWEDEGVMHLYDCVVAVEGLHMCISNGLAITHEFGCVPQ